MSLKTENSIKVEAGTFLYTFISSGLALYKIVFYKTHIADVFSQTFYLLLGPDNISLFEDHLVTN